VREIPIFASSFITKTKYRKTMNTTELMQKGFATNTKRIAKVLSQFEGDKVFFRPYDKVNHISWTIGHLAFVRNTIIKILNPTEKLQFFDNEKTLYAPGTPLQANEAYPAAEILMRAYEQRGERIVELLNGLDQAKWDSESPFQFPFGNTVGVQVWTFFKHESEHLGEMVYLKNIATRIE
jgi:hypothetical protein